MWEVFPRVFFFLNSRHWDLSITSIIQKIKENLQVLKASRPHLLQPWNIQKLSKTPRANNICIFESMIFQILKKRERWGILCFLLFLGGRTSSFWWRSDTLDCKPFWKLHTKGPISFVDFLFFLWVRMWSRNLSKNRIQKKTYLFLVPETTVF